MSDMNPDKIKIKLNDEEYGLSFNINTIDKFQERFNCDFGEVGKMLQNNRKIYKTVKFLLTVMINESNQEYNENHEDKKPIYTEDQIGRKLTMQVVFELGNQLMDLIIESIPKGDDDSPSGRNA